MNPDKLFSALYHESPYAGFPLKDYPEKAGGWHSDSALFDQLIDELKPELVIEVGTWLGGSALHMAKQLKALNNGGRLLCIDTWLGASEFWDNTMDAERYQALAIKHGYPTVFYQFIANVLHAGLEGTIIPFPQTSANAAVWLGKRTLRSKLIYIDGSHEEADVYADLSAYWPLLEHGGVMFGDDYDAYWPGVIIAVNRFAQERGLEVESGEGFWRLTRQGVVEPPRRTEIDELAALRAENAVLRAAQASDLVWSGQVSHFMAETNRARARAGFFYEQWQQAEKRLREQIGK